MASKIANPFQLIDDYLLDHIFNPLVWWSEYNYGRHAIYWSVALSTIGFILISFYFLQMESFLMGAAALFMTHCAVSTAEDTYRQWIQNNKTGKNVRRFKSLGFRIVCLFAGAYLVVITITGNYIETMFVIGFVFCGPVTEYLESTDVLPPTYKNRHLTTQEA